MSKTQNNDQDKSTQHLSFKNKIVLVTGAGRGIGRASALAFAKEGARVAIHYNTSEEAAQKTVLDMERYGGPHMLLPGNIAIADEIPKMMDRVVEHFGRLDILVNNAAVILPHDINKVSYTDWQKAWDSTLKVNLIGTANMTFCAAQQMMKQGGGRIINVSSRGAFRGEPTQPAYGASKAGLNAMAQSLAQALAPHQIYIATVAPGYVETDRVAHLLTGTNGEAIRAQSPTGRVAKPEEVANAILNLAREGMEFTTGCILDVNGASYLR